ncbi:MAG TPA: caspase family protein [Thermoanaerobaculia bacterium]
MKRKGALILLVLLIGSGSPCLASRYDYTKLYQKGRKAALEGYPRKALFYLAGALEQRATEGEPWVIAYGHHRVPYLPHFYVGRAFFDLGEYDRALEAWQESLRQGAVKEHAEFKELRERIDFIEREIVPQIAGSGRTDLAEAAGARSKTAEILGALRATGQDPGDLETRSNRIGEALTQAEKAVAGGERERDLRQIEEARETVEAARVEATQLLREAQDRVTSVGAAQVDAGLDAALGALRSGSCERDALARLSALRQLSSSRPDLRTEEREVRLVLGLARAFLQCGELDSAAQHLIAAAHEGRERDEVARLERELASAREKQRREELDDFEARNAALTAFAESAAVIDTGRCDPAVIDRLQRSSQAVFQRPDWRQVAAWIAERAGIPYIPRFFLAKARWSCGDAEKSIQSLVQSKRWQETPLFGYELEAEALESRLREEQIKRFYSGSYALVLLASRYQRWEDLPGVEAEDKQIEERLRKIGFNVVDVVRNPTKRELERAVQRFIAAYGKGAGNRNRLLIYYAGHGDTLNPQYGNRSVPLGFLVPVDAARKPSPGEPADDFIESAISMDQVEGWARQIEALHAMFVFNSCYSGTIFWAISRSRGGLLPVVVEEAVREPVRLFITAGNDKQEVPDTRAFLKSLLAALTWEEDADFSRDGFLSGSELCLFLKNRMTRAGVAPQCGTMPPPYNRGDLIFARPPEHAPDAGSAAFSAQPNAEALLAELSFWKAAAEPGSAEGYHRYLERYPKGRFAGLAQYRLMRLDQSDAMKR